ncbi:hypothetical protein AC477_00270 [miscellaneous Crenarchaeota group-1 archaeon SG8-32-1]|uniref:Calcineurin-like phosphoesterase domain-containing protein n=1 Tax=miscellaneous Crenarchaeota group-1 archaeon SG8-32-1 TaxID=1685124 RepID=A0A0M0C2K5_9ARCH|nr:MAG: hypothetical protein AC477_00270 [miscellaneous Crenarchaeota group-1 archaeon SG8-32-1]
MNRKIASLLGVILSVLIIFLISNSISIIPGSIEEDYGWKFVILGDTQDLSAHRPDLFFNATQWIAKQSDIIYVTQMGDLVDNKENLTQWQTAYDAMHILDGHVEWGTVPGNHDLYPMPINGTAYGGEDPTNYNAFFGECEHYDIVKNQFIFIYVRFDHLDYAESVIQDHPNLYTVIVTHSCVFTDTLYDENLVERVAEYDNVIAVLCGHNPGSTLVRCSNGRGGEISLILTNYQDIPPITNSLKVCTVFKDRIEVKTFEPMNNTYKNGSYGFMEEFSFSYD